MSSDPDITKIRRDLLERRREIIQRRLHQEDAWQNMKEPDVEFEEEALKEQLSLALDRLDDREKAEIERIEMALRKMDTGRYGFCETCGENISLERMQALPWAEQCIVCAGKLGEEQPFEGASPRVEAPSETTPTPDLEGMPDEDVIRAIYDKLHRDGRVEPAALQIECRAGVVSLQGSLPSESKRQILMSILQDGMGLREVEDYLDIRPLDWQREDRVPIQSEERRPDETTEYGEDSTEEVFESQEEGIPLTPPDKLVPEKE